MLTFKESANNYLKILEVKKIVYGFVFVLLATILFIFTAKVIFKGSGHDRIIASFYDLKQVDMRWNVDALSIASSLKNNYDSVVSLPEVTRRNDLIIQILNESSEINKEDRERLENKINYYKNIMVKKSDLIERIKSSHAVLINSSRFISSFNKELIFLLDHDNELRNFKELVEVKYILYNALSLVVSFIASKDDALHEELHELIDRLNSYADKMPLNSQSKVKNFVVHILLLMDQYKLRNQLLNELQLIKTDYLLSGIESDYVMIYNKFLDRNDDYRTILIFYSIIVFLIFSYIIIGMIKNYKRLNVVNMELKVAHNEAQLKLIHSSKMTALGEMVAGIAHEINTPLAYVSAIFSVLNEQITKIVSFSKEYENQPISVKILKKNDVDLDDILTLLEDGKYGINQISELIVTMKNFGRIDQLEVDDFLVEDGLDNALLMANYTVKDNLVIKKEYAGVPKIRCIPSHINQVFLNIITNAIQAILAYKKNGQLIIKTVKQDESMIRIDISDDGPGISQEVLPKIFDPFFTTKEIGKGTGMGLSISYKIIESHGGRILVDSNEGQGATFSILLPINKNDSKSATFFQV